MEQKRLDDRAYHYVSPEKVPQFAAAGIFIALGDLLFGKVVIDVCGNVFFYSVCMDFVGAAAFANSVMTIVRVMYAMP